VTGGPALAPAPTPRVILRRRRTSVTDRPPDLLRRRVPPGSALGPRLSVVLHRLDRRMPFSLGYPVATDIDYRRFGRFLKHMINNCGDPWHDPIYPGHAMDAERDVLAWTADLLRAPDGWHGHMTNGGSEANLDALWQARTKLPNAIVYTSAAAHYSVRKACDLLGLTTVVVAADRYGEIDYASLRALAGWHRARPAIVVATCGTTFTEACDKVPRIHEALDAAGIGHRWIHADGALAALPRALTGDGGWFDLTVADSVCFSFHKFLGIPVPAALVISRSSPRRPGPAIAYIGVPDTTISGSRPGLAALMAGYAIDRYGHDGHRDRTMLARDLADYTSQQLTGIGWPTWRNPGSFTVLLRPPPSHVAARWALPVDGGWAKLICMPGKTRRHIDLLITALKQT
jgi:histidine decarboxylase